MSPKSFLFPTDTFAKRHLGPRDGEIRAMLDTLGLASLDALIAEAVPGALRTARELDVGPERGEAELLEELELLAAENEVFRSFIGMGYHDTITPPVIQRNILENPGWYTQYTPYQAEIAQGRMEALVNYQTVVADLTGLPLANASLLDEATAAAEAMTMAHAAVRGPRNRFFVSDRCHPQTIAVVKTRAQPLGLEVVVGKAESIDLSGEPYFGVLVQYPDTEGRLDDWRSLAEKVHAHGALFIMAADLLALTLFTPPGELGADICVGSSQRFGVPMGFGGPHAAFLSTSEIHARQMPGRIIGVSKDATGRPAYRLALQTREQHIRRDKATSNICTAQVLLAIMASMYAVYHGPEGLRAIARRVYGLALTLKRGLEKLSLPVTPGTFFDTLVLGTNHNQARKIRERAESDGANLRYFEDGRVGISLDEKSTAEEVALLLELISGKNELPFDVESLADEVDPVPPEDLRRTSDFLRHEVFHRYHSEHEMLRYIHRLQAKDLSLTTSMIPLGSCTMKLNATTEMLPVTWPEFSALHPFAPQEQWAGYQQLFDDLESWLSDITGFDAVSLQPNAGSQGEYAGLLVIRAYHEAQKQAHRNVCLIPVSAHGTNPASAVMAGMKVVPVACDERGNIDVADLSKRAEAHAGELAALMITYPSTHGVFEAEVKEICAIIHRHGGQVYMDGANMNAQVGLMRPAELGADVCHLNLHKTFCIPHGGGGPGMGPIGVKKHLAPFLPGHPVFPVGGEKAIGPVAAAPFGSPSILPISWVYIALMGSAGLKKATQVAILNANYMAKRLEGHYQVVYTGPNGRVAHEFILDLRPFKKSAGVEPDDVAKRLMDFGFHAPTMSWPVAGTLMVEPTESESRAELDRFCDAMIAIRGEIRAIEEGRLSREDNPLKNAPHTAAAVTATEWAHGYPREQAAFPLPWVRQHKFWPPVARVDNAYGDRNLMCTCPPMDAYEA